MDHTPGQRQWRNLASYRIYHSDYKTWTDEEFRGEAAKEIQEQRDGCADDNAAFAIGWAKQHHIPMASHDDTTAEQVRDAVQDGVCISEFPTTMEAAQTAADCGLVVTMGAPNIVRGKSSSGNVSALDVAKAGCLGSMSSDYVPVSLLGSRLHPGPGRRHAPSQGHSPRDFHSCLLIGLTDRGSLTKGLSADMVHVRMRDGRPSCAASGERDSASLTNVFGRPAAGRPVSGEKRMRGRLIYVMGPSGSGKDSLMSGLLAAYPDAGLVAARRYITRPESAGGSACRRYAGALRGTLENGAFCMQWQSHGLFYGVPRPSGTTSAGRIVLVNGSRGYLPEAEQTFPFLEPLLVDVPQSLLEERLISRGRRRVST